MKQHAFFSLTSHAHLAPNIPLNKLQAATASLNCVDGENVYVLIDCTAFGGAKEALLITDHGIRHKEIGPWTKPVFLDWKTLSTLKIGGKQDVLFVASQGGGNYREFGLMDCDGRPIADIATEISASSQA